MRRFPPLLLTFLCLLPGCTKSKPSQFGVAKLPASTSPAVVTSQSTSDPVQGELVKLAGKGATNCGVFTSSVPAELKGGSECAEKTFKTKAPFYIEYQMPGLTVGVAGNAQGKFYSAQSASGGAGLTSGECPAELRVASSGRVTCYARAASPVRGADSSVNPPGVAGVTPPGHPI
jgi:hypothetical protein